MNPNPTVDSALSSPTQRTESVTARFARLQRKRERIDKAIEMVLLAAACVSVATTTGIVYVLFHESLAFFKDVPVSRLLFDREWTPLFSDAQYGIGVLLSGTFTSSLVALAVAIP